MVKPSCRGRLVGTTLCALALALALPSSAEDGQPWTLDAVYTGEWLSNRHGGLKQQTRYLDNFDLILAGNLAATGWEGGSVMLYGLYNNDTTFSDSVVGDAQVVSNIDTDRHFRLYEAWFMQEFAGGKASVKTGLIDLNSEFDAKVYGSLFSNSSHGIGPDISQTGLNGPSIFPSTALAIRADWSPRPDWKLRAGVFDAVPNDPERPSRMRLAWDKGSLLIGELEYTTGDAFRAALGAWGYSSEFEPILPGAHEKTDGNQGIYGFVEGRLSHRLGGYLRVGLADDEINPLGGFLGGGLVLNAPLPGRDHDQAGIAIAHALNGEDFEHAIRMGGGRPRDETNIEISYRARISDSAVVQPMAQYVIDPGGAGAIRDALVIGMRFEIMASR